MGTATFMVTLIGDECADVAMQFVGIVKAAVDGRMRVPFSKIEAGRFTTG